MKDRVDLRKHFQEADKMAMMDKNHAENMQCMDDLRSTLVDSFDILVQFLQGNIGKTEVVNQLKSISTPDVDKVVKEIIKLDKSVANNKLELKPIIDALNHLTREVTMIPLKMPKGEPAKETIKVSNLGEIVLDIKPLEKAIKDLKLDVKVDAPVINTEKVDLKPLKDVMLDLLKAVNKQKPVESVKVSNLDEIKLADLTNVEKKLDEANKNLKDLVKKPTGGSSGGGGNGTPYTNAAGIPKNVVLTIDGKIPVEAAAPVGGATETTVAKLTKPTDNQQVELINAIRVLTIAMTSPAWVDKTTNTLRNMPQGGTVTTVTTVGTVSALTAVDGYQGKLQVINQNNAAWSTVVRTRIG